MSDFLPLSIVTVAALFLIQRIIHDMRKPNDANTPEVQWYIPDELLLLIPGAEKFYKGGVKLTLGNTDLLFYNNEVWRIGYDELKDRTYYKHVELPLVLDFAVRAASSQLSSGKGNNNQQKNNNGGGNQQKQNNGQQQQQQQGKKHKGNKGGNQNNGSKTLSYQECKQADDDDIVYDDGDKNTITLHNQFKWSNEGGQIFIRHI